MFNVAVIGLGAISQTHIEAIRMMDDVRLAAVCDIDPAKEAMVPGVPFYTDIDTMCCREQLDCAHICLPHYLHVPTAFKLASYGIHIFMEKPAGLNTQDAQRLLQIQQEGKVKLGICLQHRYDKAVICAKELIDSQRFGALKGMRAMVAWDRTSNYYTKDLWRGTIRESGGGVMLSQAIHTLDLMVLLGGEIQWVKGMTGNLLLEDIEVEDTAVGHIHYRNNTNGVFYTTVTHCYNDTVELELVFENRIVMIAHEKLAAVSDDGSSEILAENDQIRLGKNYYGSGHFRAIRSFYDAVIHDTDDYVPVTEAIKSVQLIDAVMLSSRNKERIVL